MKSTSAKFKQLMSAGGTRTYVVTIYMTLADDTQLTLTEEDIWMDSFRIETASSGQSSFDIGSAIIGECKVQLNNWDERFSDYDFFNATATVWVGLVGDTENDTQTYYRMGFYTVDEPSFSGTLVSLTLLDNMWKLDVPLSEVNLTYPLTIKSAIQSMCTYCGVILGTQTFNGQSYQLTEAPDGDMNCREYLQYLAMIGCNFCVMNDQGALCIKWYDDNSEDEFANNYQTTLGTDDITITGIKFVVNDVEHRIGTTGYVLELENPLVNENNVNAILNLIWSVLQGFTLRTFNIQPVTDLACEVGDACTITDAKGNEVTTYITYNSFGFVNQTVECNAITQSRSLSKRYSKAVQAVVEESRRQAQRAISNYDLAVQLMNNLAVNAMGGYQDYDDLPTGGRVYYLSNRPITKDPITGMCVFQAGSVVFKASGDGFFVSTDGGTTWQNGYSAQTGQLVVNVLNAIGLSAEWIKVGELTVGGIGSGSDHPSIVVKDSGGYTICTINQSGIIMNKGYIESSNYEYTSGHFSDTGTRFDITNDYLRSPFFAFDENGAYIKGEVEADSGQIGAATITQDAITIRGDVELYKGTGTFTFRPTDYYFVDDFRLTLTTAEGTTSSVTLVKHENGSDTTVGTYTATDEGVLTALLDHTIGTDEEDYYQLTITGSETTVLADDVILAYMGQQGFMGTLRGIFKGHLDSNSGRIAGMKYNLNQFTVGDNHLRLYGSSEDKYVDIDLTDPNKPNIQRHYMDGNDPTTQSVAWGTKQPVIPVSISPPSSWGAGEDNEIYIEIPAGVNTPYKMWHWTGSAWSEMPFAPFINDTPLNTIYVSSNDLGEGQPLAAGSMYIVYEA